MRRVWLLAGMAVVSLAAVGCNDTTDEVPSASIPTSSAKTSEPQVKSDGKTPKEIVETLMQAMLAHDEPKAHSMLTAKARVANVLKADTPEGVRYKVGDVEMIGEDNAHVAAAWFHPEQGGGEYRVMTMWLLRKDPEGFRVYGNIMIVPQLAQYDGGRVEFDFEDAEQFAATESRVLELLEKASAAGSGGSVAENPGKSAATPR